MIQLSAQHTELKTQKESVDSAMQSVLFQQAGSSQLSPKSTKDTSKFASALEKFLGLSGLKLQSTSNNTNSDIDSEGGKAPQHATGLQNTGKSGMFQISSQHQIGVEGNPKNSAEAARLTSENKKTGTKSAFGTMAAGEAQTSGKPNHAGQAIVKESSPVPISTKQAGQTSISDLAKNNPFTTVQKSGSTGIGVIQSGREKVAAPGSKDSTKSGFVNLLGVANNVNHLNASTGKHTMSMDELSAFKKLAEKQGSNSSKKMRGHNPKMAGDSQSQTGASQQTAKKSPFFSSGSGTDASKGGKNIQQVGGDVGKSFTVEQKTEKYAATKEGQTQTNSDSDSATKRSGATVLQTSTAKKASQHNFDVRLGNISADNPSSTFRLTDTDNNPLDFTFEGGTATEQLQTDSKGTQDIKLNTPFHQIHSMAGRRDLSIQVAQTIQRGWSSQSQNMEQWQNHRFTFDDGNSLNVSFRQAEGGIQLQLGTSNTELSKLIQQNLNEINRHLQQQLNMNIDLEMQHFGSGEFGKSNDGDASASNANVAGTETGNETGQENTSQKTMRYLGFNNKEWTA